MTRESSCRCIHTRGTPHCASLSRTPIGSHLCSDRGRTYAVRFLCRDEFRRHIGHVIMGHAQSEEDLEEAVNQVEERAEPLHDEIEALHEAAEHAAGEAGAVRQRDRALAYLCDWNRRAPPMYRCCGRSCLRSLITVLLLTCGLNAPVSRWWRSEL